jgi:hypothetical protein
MSIETRMNSSDLGSRPRGVNPFQRSISDHFGVWTGTPECLKLVRFYPAGLDSDVHEPCPSPEIRCTGSARAPHERCSRSARTLVEWSHELCPRCDSDV